MRTTVSIPLHRSAHWTESISSNIERLASHCRIVVSDATQLDGTLDLLAQRFAGAAGVEFLGRRELGDGWVAHCNDLLARCGSEFAMWLPHDDEVGADWIAQGEALLDERPDAVVAVGTLIDAQETAADATHPARVELHPAFESPDSDERMAVALFSTVLGNASDLGLLFRGLVRRREAPQLPTEPAHGAWADLFWAVRLLSRGAAVRMPTAQYAKRWVVDSARTPWPGLRDDPALRGARIPAALADLPMVQTHGLVLRAWSEEAVELIARIDSLWEHVRGLEQHTAGLERHAAGLEQLASALTSDVAAVADEAERLRGMLREAETRRVEELAMLRDQYESSRSWRVTRGLRALFPRR